MSSQVNIIKGQGGLGRRNPSADMVTGLVMHGLATSEIALQEVKTLYSVEDAIDLKIDADYDITNEVMVFYHISEYFRLNPSGELWILLADQVTAFDALVDKSLTTTNAKKLLTAAGGRIKQLGVAFNPPAGYTETLTDGLDAQVFTAITKANALADEEFALFRPVYIVVEGRHFNGTAAAAEDLRTLDSPNVSVLIGADLTPAFRTALAAYTNTNVLYHAAIGSIMGKMSAVDVGSNIGALGNGNLQGNGAFLVAGLSSNLPLTDYSDAAQKLLDDKGYIYVTPYQNYSGVYFQNDHSCVELASDYYRILNNRTMNKAATLVRGALLPFLKGKIFFQNDGTIAFGRMVFFETSARGALTPMFTADEISQEPDVYIDPKQKVLQTGKLIVKYKIIPVGSMDEIDAYLNFTTSNN